MPFIRLSDNYIDHPKFLALSASAFRLWHEGMAFCRKHQTDGAITTAEVKGFRYYQAVRVKELATPCKAGTAPLWETVASGYQVHDYLFWNLSKAEENELRDEAKQRMALSRNPELRKALRERDGNDCRYCGRPVSWGDRRGARGGTYDHVDPSGPDTLDNLVIACRGCNGRKGHRTPAEACLTLLPPPRSDLSLDSSHRLVRSGSDWTGSERAFTERESERKPIVRGATRLEPLPPDPIAERAGRLLERYAALFCEHQRGAKYHSRPHLDLPKACKLVETWPDDARLEKLAILVLTTNDPWIAGTDRGFAVFVAKASWADAALTKWEARHGEAG